MNEQDRYTWQNFGAVLIGLALLLSFGMLGYVAIEKWEWVDALYMTFITFSTVGFREVGPMNWGGRLFSMVIILMGLIILAMLSASVTSLFLRRELLTTFKTRKLKKEIMKLHGHTVLCGAGETGKTVIKEFLKAKKDIVIIEDTPDAIRIVREMREDLLIIEGDATKDEVLEEANIKNAGGLITALSEDTANLFVVISARALKPDLTIIARAVDPHAAGKMYKAGATHVVSPNLTEGMRMAATMLRPTVVSFLDIMARSDELGLRLEEFQVRSGSAFADKLLKELEIPQRAGLIVIGIKQGDKFQYNPRSTTRLNADDILIVLGNADKIERLSRLAME